MKRLTTVAALAVVLAACGTEESRSPGTTAAHPSTTVTSTLPGADQRDLLEAARATWETNRPATYRFGYALACECDQGPWTVVVDGTLVVDAHRDDTGLPADDLPYATLDAVFEDIAVTLDAGEVPVDVEYDSDFGYPRSYVWNGPELPVDGGFILTVTSFEPDPPLGDPQLRRELADAMARWENSGSTDYDYLFTRTCFCPEEFVGPYRVAVRADIVTAATFNGTDLFDIDILEIGRYEEIIETVPGVFAEIERALVEADSIDVTYHPVYGYPTDVFIDWELNVADEEVGYRIEDLREPLATLESCSTTGLDIDLVDQPGLPETVAQKREAIFEAAMSCDVAALEALTSGAGFTASFGGGDAATLWRDEELQGQPTLLALVRHLNLDHTAFGDGDATVGYTWPSAFLELESPDGAGLAADEYAALLELYTGDELEEMFEFFGGYAGYRLAIEPDGTWVFFVAGD
jgi:hypothetical protein